MRTADDCGLENGPGMQSLCVGPILGHESAELDRSGLRFLSGAANHKGGRAGPSSQQNLNDPPTDRIAAGRSNSMT
jgi:hypothetical protein